MKILRSKLLRGASVIFSAGCGLFAAMVYFPNWAFPYVVAGDGIELRSDERFSAADGQRVVAAANAKLRGSPFSQKEVRHQACICNTAWRRRLFFLLRPRAGSIHYYGARTVFLRGAIVRENRLIAPSGEPVLDERTLDYFIAHEITHAIAEDFVGVLRYHRLPDWIKEGYADYVARGSAWRELGNRKAYLSEDPKMNSPSRAPYLRYNLLVAYLLERRDWTPARLHTEAISQAAVEQMVRDEIKEEVLAPTSIPHSQIRPIN